VSPAGQEVRLDQVIGVKRQPLFHEAARLDLDSRAPGRKYKGKTYRELLASEEGREYLAWMAEHFNEPEIREFVQRILGGEEVVTQRGRQLNPHWYEAGAMKAARNARFRLIPGTVRAQVIAAARQSGKTRVIEPQRPEAPSRIGPYAPTEKQVAFYQRLVESPVFTEDERRRALEWLASRATRQTIKDQIDWLKRQVETRKVKRAGESAA
jgi:hypothetical protein